MQIKNVTYGREKQLTSTPVILYQTTLKKKNKSYAT